ncbi:MAG: DUF1244 domain-containing protein [Hyphomicrobium sp.]|nr:DUF1244 domain-containing protein [Hyphomicrobium sp.]
MSRVETASGAVVSPVEIVRADASAWNPILILCDHASNAIPAEYDALGLAPAEFNRHIAYDIGARDVALGLARRTGATAILSTASRLLIDLNRGLDDPTLIMRLSDGAVVPGNRTLTPEDRERRIGRFWRPYHDAIRQEIDRLLDAGVVPWLVSIHTFTPNWKGIVRPWHAGILWDRDPRLARVFLEGLRRDARLLVGDNEPYSGRLEGDCLYQHGTQRGLAHAIVEIRQDLVGTASGADEWAGRLAAIVTESLADDARKADLSRQILFGSATGRRPALRDTPSGDTAMTTIEDATTIELEAAAYRKLVAHLRKRTDVQNIDMMTLAGFCRNCLANWYMEAAGERGISMSKDEAREIVYGEPYKDWQAKHQKEASADQLQAFEAKKPKDH